MVYLFINLFQAFSGGRLVQAAARTGDFPRCLAKAHGKVAPVPARGLIFQSVLATIHILMGNFERLLVNHT